MWDLQVPVGELVARGVLVYLFLLVGMRLSGKQQVGQLTIADLVVVMLISNALENSMVGGEESLPGGMIVAGTLFVVEKGVTIGRARSKRFQKALEGEPSILFWRGKVRYENLRKEHMSEDDLKTFLRERGYMQYDEVELVILETDGQVSVIPREKEAEGGAGNNPHKHKSM